MVDDGTDESYENSQRCDDGNFPLDNNFRSFCQVPLYHYTLKVRMLRVTKLRRGTNIRKFAGLPYIYNTVTTTTTTTTTVYEIHEDETNPEHFPDYSVRYNL